MNSPQWRENEIQRLPTFWGWIATMGPPYRTLAEGGGLRHRSFQLLHRTDDPFGTGYCCWRRKDGPNVTMKVFPDGTAFTLVRRNRFLA